MTENQQSDGQDGPGDSQSRKPSSISTGVASPSAQDETATIHQIPSHSEQLNKRYTLRKEVGSGGFGSVYEAWDEILHRTVAVKVPRKDKFSSEEKWEAFLAEARVAARLNHPGIVAIHDVGRADDGRCFIVMEFIEGGTLSSLLSRQRLSPDRVARLLADIADAVHFANSMGLIHRDLKPSNVLIDSQGRPFVADFGLALYQVAPHLRNAEIVGTPQYMAPEQARGENHRLDARTDVWSLGVILYHLLTSQLPFSNKGAFSEILDPYFEPVPPRQHNPSIDPELERICLRCLGKRMTDRFSSASLLAEELRAWLEKQGNRAIVPATSGLPVQLLNVDASSDRETTVEKPRVVPKGLRSFTNQDAHFFLKLLPGPRDRDGIPESICFWKHNLESGEHESAFSVGLLYGPSGCGKSSFLKAGLIPHLSPSVLAVYVESTGRDLESRTASVLRRAIRGLGRDWRLTEILVALRDQNLLPENRKRVVLIFDQFEQWLHQREQGGSEELVGALRQCDGVKVQCLLAVRDDFGMAATRFMDDIEVPIVQGHNFATIDRFSAVHARYVLAEFGRAFGQLPDTSDSRNSAQERFLDDAVNGLMEDRKVVPVRLALFAEMVKDRPWVPRTLQEVGGTEGVGVAFLDETFTSRSANPIYLRHQNAVQRVLRAFLPEPGLQIRGARVSRQQLIQASGYAADSNEWDELLRILDTDLRLITPADSDMAMTDSSGRTSDSTTLSSSGSREPQFQLTHDYLVPVIRTWLTRNQRATRRGRSELRLAEQAALWSSRPEMRLLPPLWMWLDILLYTRRVEWTASQQRMMRTASRFHGVRLMSTLAMTALLIFGGWTLRNQVVHDRARMAGDALVQRLIVADTPEVPAIVREIKDHRTFVDPILRRIADDEGRPDKERTLANLGLLDIDSGRSKSLLVVALQSEPEPWKILADALTPLATELTPSCWKAVDDKSNAPRVLRAACLLANWSPDDARWPILANPVVEQLLREPPLSSGKWAEYLRPAKAALIPSLERIFHDDGASPAAQSLAAGVLADYHDDNIPRLVGLLAHSNHDQFHRIFPVLERNKELSVVQLVETLKSPLAVSWSAENPPQNLQRPSEDTIQAIARGHGAVFENFAWCQTLLRIDFDTVADEMRKAGYSLNCFRPFRSSDGIRIAAIWERDGRECQFLTESSAAEIRQQDEDCRHRGLVPADVTCLDPFPKSDDARYAALWIQPPAGLIDARMYVDILESDHINYWQPLNSRNFVPRTNARAVLPSGPRYSSVRWKMSKRHEYDDRWNESAIEYAQENHEGWFQVDLRQTPTASGLEISSVWCDWNGFDSDSCHGLSAESHILRGNDWAARGWRPFSIAVAWDPRQGQFVAGSVWRQPVASESLKDSFTRRQAQVASALLRLGQEELIWPLLRHQPDPRLRTWIVHSLCLNGVPARRLWAQFLEEKDVSARRALLLSLARVTGRNSEWATPEIVEHLREIHEQHPDAGIHSACRLVLESLGQQTILDVVHRLDDEHFPANQTWYQTSLGKTLTIVNGPVEFILGSRRNDPHHEAYMQAPCRIRIPRSFAVSMTEVTVREFQEFDSEFEFARDYSPLPDCPANMVTLYDAMKYCRWLSEREEIAEEQMCYPPLSQINENMKLPSDYLHRTGYRLPTEAEWEYVCRAGTETPRFFGFATDLLGSYAWTAANSDYQAHPVARLFPNDLGLFDVLGNAMEWCQTSEFTRRRDPRGRTTDDAEEATFTPGARFIRRGGAFLYAPSVARCAHRDWTRDSSRFPFAGFRIARTCVHKAGN